jgi:endonuclease-3
MPNTTLARDEASKLACALSDAYKDVHYYLNFKTPIDLLVAAIISAQTRDETVNAITPALFKKYKTAKDYASAQPSQLAKDISKVSFAGNKAKNIISACRTIVDEYGGVVPDNIDALVSLPGIGRKTANTILINAYGKVEGIPVDTWVIKLAPRLGLSANTKPEKIEEDLEAVVPKALWGRFAYVLKAHGKSICGKVPECSRCPIEKMCPKNGVAKRA